MRIAFVDYKLNLQTGGGSNTTIHNLASGLMERGHEVSVITISPELNALRPDLPYEVVAEPIYRPEQLPGRLAVVSLLRKWESRVDLFQLESPSLILSAGLYRRLGGRAPVVAQLHIYSHFCTNISRMDATCWQHCSLLKQLRHRDERLARKVGLAPIRIAESVTRRLVANRVDRFIAVSPAMGAIHARNGLDPRKIVTIFPPVDLTSLLQRTEGAHRPADTTRGRYRIVYVGRLEPAKGVDVLLEAAAGLDFPFVLDIIGDGHARANLERLAVDLGLSAQVRFRGWISPADVAQCYLGAQLFVHPGRWPDPAPRTIVEAMVLGIPLVVSDAGGAPEMAGDAALRAIPGDAVDLRGKIEVLRNSPDLAARLAAAGKARSVQFDQQYALDQFVSLYRELCPAASRLDISAAESSNAVVDQVTL